MCARRGGGRRLSGKPRPVHAGCARRSVRVSVLRLRSARRLRRFHALDGSGQALRPSPGRRPPGLLTGYRRQSEELSRACEQRLADGLGFASQVRVLERVAELVARLVVVPYVRTTGCPSTRRRSMASIGFDGCGQAAGRRRGWLEQRGVRCVAAIGGCCPGFRGRFTRWVLVSWARFTRWVPGGGLLVRAGAGGRPGAASANRALLGGFTRNVSLGVDCVLLGTGSVPVPAATVEVAVLGVAPEMGVWVRAALSVDSGYGLEDGAAPGAFRKGPARWARS